MTKHVEQVEVLEAKKSTQKTNFNQKKSELENSELDELSDTIFKIHSIQECSDSLDLMYNSFITSPYTEEQEKGFAMVSYFHVKKLLQCMLEKKGPTLVTHISVSYAY